jgi:UDP-3-O-[3-hydroxymyristoyl] glucosamine N-acyltransferase
MSKGNLQNSIVGDNYSILPNSNLGSDGFEFEGANDTVDPDKFSHLGKVIIENDVGIFAFCSFAER